MAEKTGRPSSVPAARSNPASTSTSTPPTKPSRCSPLKSSPPESSASAPSASPRRPTSRPSSKKSVTCRCRLISIATTIPKTATATRPCIPHEPGSAAAPTAGLHFTPEILAQLRQSGIQIETITLHVGLGTFQPVRAKDLADIHLHAEHYTLPAATATAINAALAEGRRIIAAGTTTTRTLEHCAHLASTDPFEPHTGLRLHPHSGSTEIFISPGHKFRVVSGLLTNFHLPQSTLLMLVSAFAGREAVLAAYAHAVRERYRFFSYGDCMLLL